MSLDQEIASRGWEHFVPLVRLQCQNTSPILDPQQCRSILDPLGVGHPTTSTSPETGNEVHDSGVLEKLGCRL